MFFPCRARLDSFQRRTAQTCARPGMLPCEISFHRRFTALWAVRYSAPIFPIAGGHPAAPFRSRFQKFPSEPDESRLSGVMRMPCRQPAAPAARIWFGKNVSGCFQAIFHFVPLCIGFQFPPFLARSIRGLSWCPLKTTPTSRPDSAGCFSAGRETETEQQSTKKSHENKYAKQKCKAPEPARTGWQRKRQTNQIHAVKN